jgi:hypothetical protein
MDVPNKETREQKNHPIIKARVQESQGSGNSKISIMF